MSNISRQQEEFDRAAVCADLYTILRMLRKDTNERLNTRKKYLPNEDTLLHYSCYYLQKELTELLLKRQFDVNIKNKVGRTPLHKICEYRFCVFYGSDCDRSDRYDIILLLINNNADINVQDEFGFTPLHYACINYRKDYKMIELLSNISNVNLQNNKGRTPLHMACIQKELEIVRIFFSKTSKIILDIKDDDGYTAFDYIAINDDEVSDDKTNEFVRMFEEYDRINNNYSIAI